MKIHRSLAWLMLLVVIQTLAADPPSGDSGFSVEPSHQNTEWTVRFKGKKVLVCSFAAENAKPYVKELCSLSGENVLRDAPADHLHHHGLMYAIRLNGINFWEEVTESGVQKVASHSPPEFVIGPGDKPQARIRQLIHWVGPGDARITDSADAALLIEQRTLTLTIDEPIREVALHWKSEFEIGGKTNTITLSGSNYNGLGLRFAEPLDPLLEHFNSDGQPDVGGTRQDVSRHEWSAVSLARAEAPVSLVLFGHPGNAGGHSSYFTMKRPFAYLSATQALDRAPIVHRQGDRFQLNYLIVLRPAWMSREAINRRGESWQSTPP